MTQVEVANQDAPRVETKSAGTPPTTEREEKEFFEVHQRSGPPEMIRFARSLFGS